MTIISTTPAGTNGNGHTTNGHRPPAQRPGQPGVIQLLREADATQELHRHVGELVGLAHVVHGDDVRVVQAPGRLDLLREARLVLLELLLREVQVDRLDRDRAIDDGVDGLVDRAHGPLPRFLFGPSSGRQPRFRRGFTYYFATRANHFLFLLFFFQWQQNSKDKKNGKI
jgi:hypothetical protein